MVGGGRGGCGGSSAALGGDEEAAEPAGDGIDGWRRMELGAPVLWGATHLCDCTVEAEGILTGDKSGQLRFEVGWATMKSGGGILSSTVARLERGGRELGPKMGAVEDCEGTDAFYGPAEGGERFREVVKWPVAVSAPLIMMVSKGNGGVDVV
jgi:hypothetical protein